MNWHMNWQMRSRGAPARGAALALAVWAALGSGPALAAGPVTVRIENFSFVPETVTVPVGTAVTWENGDDIPHLVVLSDKSFRSKALDTHDRATFTFTKPGEMGYFCGLHPHMQGKIVVVP
jgi:plastocyanin